MYVAYKLDTTYGSIKSRPTILRFKALEMPGAEESNCSSKKLPEMKVSIRIGCNYSFDN